MRAITLIRTTALCLLAATSPHMLLAAAKPAKDAVVIGVSPTGDDRAAGTPASPYRSLERAQQAVRLVSGAHDVIVQLADGTYRISQTLRFTSQDGGRNGHTVTWQAAADAHPVISGAMPVTGWRGSSHGIYVADVPPGAEARQLWVNDELAPIASEEIRRDDYTFTREGMVSKANGAALNELEGAKHLELRATGFFTERIAPIERVDHGKLLMRQPAWDNNLWGYDTIEKPFHPELSHLYLVNSLKLLTKPGQWYLDSDAGKLYLEPNSGVDLSKADVELPHLTVLIAIGNSLDEPVRDLAFRGIRFSHTTWLGPSGEEGYASQQSGSYLTGRALAYPSDPIATCAVGCRAFESMRNEWHQMPASIQVTASERITFDHNTFAHLGQYALGIGNDADATVTGTGLGAGDVTVTSNTFTDCAGGAILAGGVQRDAHHPRDPRMINRQLIVRNNRISSISREFRDNSAILSTYVQGAVILHNDISDVPYDAIDIGYGWGMQDAGGNPNYRVRMRGYDWPQNLVYQTPTTHRDVVVAANRIHDAKKLFHDGGAIYNLSASPGTLITENYIYDIHGLIALYLDEGSRYVTVRKNVVQDPGAEWLNINTVHAAYPLRISPDNTAIDNWHDGTKIGGLWTNYQNDLILDDHLITNNNWPAEAKEIMKNAGLELDPDAPQPSTIPRKPATSPALPD
ncbi:MAG TPA: right-handed parallel beta-helix repeat-containing protein [Edaphobacter sp.]|nr:right-handed parallel beta-helix repeat-containing protein [Edaphobacter sp.]